MNVYNYNPSSPQYPYPPMYSTSGMSYYYISIPFYNGGSQNNGQKEQK